MTPKFSTPPKPIQGIVWGRMACHVPELFISIREDIKEIETKKAIQQNQ